jgi:hypothetical protein
MSDKIKDKYDFLNVDNNTLELIKKIALRILKDCKLDNDIKGLSMDLLLAHSEFNLKLYELLNADSYDFKHDVMGIEIFIDRRNFCFINMFVPKLSKCYSN